MREFIFALEFEAEINPAADILAQSPETQLRSLSCHVTVDTPYSTQTASNGS